MEIKEAVEILNKNNHWSRDNWKFDENWIISLCPDPEYYNTTRIYMPFVAIAIAEKYQRDELQKTYNLGSILISNSRFEGLYNYQIIYPSKKEKATNKN